MAHHRSAQLQDFLTLAQNAIAARVGTDTSAARAMARVDAACGAVEAHDDQRQEAGAGTTPPVCQHLEPAIASLERGPTDLAELARAMRALAPQLVWRPRASADPIFTAGHANASILGAEAHAIEQRGDVRIGISLVAPGITYPDHHHPPEEVYIVLSGGEWRQNANPWHAPGVGGIVYNPPNIIHAMRAGDEPLLAIWCLPV